MPIGRRPRKKGILTTEITEDTKERCHGVTEWRGNGVKEGYP
jgi:hypothetical protein